MNIIIITIIFGVGVYTGTKYQQWIDEKNKRDKKDKELQQQFETFQKAKAKKEKK